MPAAGAVHGAENTTASLTPIEAVELLEYTVSPLLILNLTLWVAPGVVEDVPQLVTVVVNVTVFPTLISLGEYEGLDGIRSGFIGDFVVIDTVLLGLLLFPLSSTAIT